MADGTQHALKRVRPPRVQLTYDVEIGDAIQKMELPFIVGVMADLAGKNNSELPPLSERKFTEIDRDNFNDAMASMKPSIAVSVPNKINDEGGNVNAELTFETMDDFEPANVIKQVKPLRDLFEARMRLNDLLAKLDGNDDLDQLLGDVIANTERQSEVKAAVNGLPQADDGAEEPGSDDGDEA